jgi:hypothetical protein
MLQVRLETQGIAEPHTRGSTIAPPPTTAFPLVCDEEVAKANMRFSHHRSV